MAKRDKKGKWLPGESANPAGKPVGVQSKAKDWLDGFLERDRKRAEKDWEKLTESQRWTIRAKLFDYQIPKLRSEHLDLNLDSMSEALSGQIVATILQNKLIDENNEVKFRSPDGRDDNNTADN